MAKSNVGTEPTGFFRDRHGRVAVWQWPNAPLWGWIVFKAIVLVAGQERLGTGSEHLATAFLFTWAYLEATSGEVYFRRVLGFVVMAVLILGYFR